MAKILKSSHSACCYGSRAYIYTYLGYLGHIDWLTLLFPGSYVKIFGGANNISIDCNDSDKKNVCENIAFCYAWINYIRNLRGLLRFTKFKGKSLEKSMST